MEDIPKLVMITGRCHWNRQQNLNGSQAPWRPWVKQAFPEVRYMCTTGDSHLSTLMASANLRQLHWVHYTQLLGSDEGKTFTATRNKTVPEHNEFSWFQHRLNVSAPGRHYLRSVNPSCLGCCVESAQLNWKHVLRHLWSWHTSLGNSPAAALIHHTFHDLSHAKQRRLGKINSRDGRLSKCIFRGSFKLFLTKVKHEGHLL